jgi:hypothetical protein
MMDVILANPLYAVKAPAVVLGARADVTGLAELGHQRDVRFVVLVAEERLHPAVSPLRDVMRQSRSDNTSQSSHDGELRPSFDHVKG